LLSQATVWPRKQFFLRCYLRSPIWMVINHLLLSSALIKYEPALASQRALQYVLTQLNSVCSIKGQHSQNKAINNDICLVNTCSEW
uniref:Uncharacterized protein n=1 Tax=Athene cunicularia TaxID=194338 RepID=A0A663MG50_ATHCN